MSHLEPRHTAIISSQSAFPARASVRTFIQTWLPQVLAALVILPLVVQAIVDEVNRHGVVLPDWLGLALGGILTACAVISAILARIMAIPSVDAWLRRFGLSSTPKIAPVTADGVHVITNIVDTSALPGYEVSEVSDAKTEAADIIDQEHDGDNIATAETIVERLMAMGWRPTR